MNVDQTDPLAALDCVQIFQGTDDATPAIISRKIALADRNEEFRYIVVAVGTGDVKVEVSDLPEGLTYSDKGPRFDVRIEDGKPQQAGFTGVISGRYKSTSEHVFKITASNSKGTTTEKVTIRPHSLICPTPPMGWLSWEFFHTDVTQEGVMKAIDGMDRAGLARYGYKYVTIDDGWQGERIPGQPLKPNDKFPNMKALSDYARERGFILGIYTSPWSNSYAGYEGSGHYETLDIKQFADWNIGYLKLDYRPWEVKQLSIWHDLLRESGADIALAFSNHGLFDGGGEFLSDICDVWRTGWDITPKWERVKACVYDQYLDVQGCKYLHKGHWPDPDMPQIGILRENKEMPENEQHFQMSIWSILPAPLLLSCDMNRLSDFHLSLLTNEEVIAVNQDPLGLPAAPVNGDTRVLAKPLSTGAVAVGFFNHTDSEVELSVSPEEVGLKGPQPVRDIWARKDIANASSSYTEDLGPRSARLFVIGRSAF